MGHGDQQQTGLGGAGAGRGLQEQRRRIRRSRTARRCPEQAAAGHRDGGGLGAARSTTGSAARRSRATRARPSRTVPPSRPRMVGESHAWRSPPQTQASSSVLVAAASSPAPAASSGAERVSGPVGRQQQGQAGLRRSGPAAGSRRHPAPADLVHEHSPDQRAHRGRGGEGRGDVALVAPALTRLHQGSRRKPWPASSGRPRRSPAPPVRPHQLGEGPGRPRTTHEAATNTSKAPSRRRLVTPAGRPACPTADVAAVDGHHVGGHQRATRRPGGPGHRPRWAARWPGSSGPAPRGAWPRTSAANASFTPGAAPGWSGTAVDMSREVLMGRMLVI